ncbi:MAG: hypothetical protein AB7G44_14350 [Bacteroidia bacterium]
MSENKNIIAVLAVCSLLLILFAFSYSDGYGGADSFQHYMISRYSWKHPHLFLDHWGKPVFTLLSSPFSQLGFKGLFAFNLLATLLSAFFVYRISTKLNTQNAALPVLFFIAMPMVLLVAVSGLTEPLFGLVLVLSVWLFANKKYLFSILLLSFLPLVRSEGFVVFPVIVFALLLNKEWKYIPLLALGGLVYSIAGYFVFDDFLWLINRSPYKMQTGIYGSGPWYHFILSSRYIFGLPVALLVLFGLWFSVPKSISWLKEEKNIIRLLIAGNFLAYFVAHSYVWWKGTGSSLGLERVIAGVCPLAALVAFEAYCYVEAATRKYFSQAWILIILFIAIIKTSYGVLAFNTQQDRELSLMRKAAEWIKSNPQLLNQRLFYYNPQIAFLLDKDIFDRTQVEQLWGLIDENEPLLWLEDGQYLVWDAHFGNNEGQTPIDKLLHKPNVKILKRFYPEEQGPPVLGGHNYEIFVFEKQSGWKDSIIEIIPDSTSTLASLKSKSFEVTPQQEYVNAFEESFTELQNSELVYLDIELKYPADKTLNKDELTFVLDMNCKGQTLKYDVTDLWFVQQENEYKILRKRYMLPPLTNECATVKTYFWNIKKVDVQGIKIETRLFHVPQNP